VVLRRLPDDPVHRHQQQHLGHQRALLHHTEQERYQLKLRGALTPDHVLEGNYLEFSQDTTGRAGLTPGDLLTTQACGPIRGSSTD
jgi:hypothetical protein